MACGWAVPADGAHFVSDRRNRVHRHLPFHLPYSYLSFFSIVLTMLAARRPPVPPDCHCCVPRPCARFPSRPAATAPPALPAGPATSPRASRRVCTTSGSALTHTRTVPSLPPAASNSSGMIPTARRPAPRCASRQRARSASTGGWTSASRSRRAVRIGEHQLGQNGPGSGRHRHPAHPRRSGLRWHRATRLPGRQQRAGHIVSIQHLCAERRPQPAHLTLAAPDPAGECDPPPGYSWRLLPGWFVFGLECRCAPSCRRISWATGSVRG